MDDPSVDEERAPPPFSPECSMTDRELDVLRYLPTRLSTTDIAAKLGISPNTVKTHLKNIYRKLEARSRNQAIVKAATLQILPGDSAALLSPPAPESAPVRTKRG